MLSVIVPVYNTSAYLEACIQSIQNQTYADLEIICINDGSDDNSLEILSRLQNEDSRIIVVSQNNQGVSSARNRGLEIAKGEYITFVDSDDCLEKEMYMTLIDLAEKNCADVAHCGYKKIYSDGTIKDIMGTGIVLQHSPVEACEYLLTGKYFVGSPCNKVYKRNVIKHIRFNQSLKFNEDILFNIQAFMNSKKLTFYDLPLYIYYERMDSACSKTADIIKKRNCVIAARKIYDYLKSDILLRPIAARRVYRALIDYYRTIILACEESDELLAIETDIYAIIPLCGNFTLRDRFNSAFLLKAPHIYKYLYTIYDKIRKPNWDL